MSNKQLRNWLRIGHLVAGIMLAAYIYSSSLQASEAYTLTLQIVVIPAVSFSGLVLWQQGRINKWLRKRGNSRTSVPSL